jgi:hypothetical protein
MAYTDTAKNLMIAADGVTHLSAHTAYPGTSGTSEVTGGSPAYARKSITYAAASSGSKSASNQPVFDIPASTTVKWVGAWSASSGGNFLRYSPLGADEKDFTVDVTANTITTDSSHGFTASTVITFYGGTVPAGLTAGTEYYPVSISGNTFSVSATQGGSAIDITAIASSDCRVSKLVAETFASQGTLTISSDVTSVNS